MTTAAQSILDAAVAPVVADVVTTITNAVTATAGGWYVVNRTNEDEAEIRIYDVIGSFGVSAEQFVRDLGGITARTVNVRINTPGGEVPDATAIYNAIRQHPARFVMHVDGMAASAGSWIAVAGDEVRMADNAYFMIHNSRGGVMGEAEDMRRYAEVLEKMNDNIAGMYAKKAGKPKKHWRNLMDLETWFTAEEAKAEGLVDTIYRGEKKQPSKATASFDFKIYNQAKIPTAVLDMWGITQSSTPPVPEVSPCGEPLQALQKGSPMATDLIQSPPAQTPAAVTQGVPQGESPQAQVERFNAQAAQSYIEKGRTQGFAEGKQFAENSMRQIMAACPGRPDIAVNAFLAGQNAATVALIHNAAMQAEAKAYQEKAQLEVENARLQAIVATGGHPGVGFHATSAPENRSIPEGLDPEAQAKLEWDGDPMIRAKNNNNEKAWMLYRVNELKGNVRVLKK